MPKNTDAPLHGCVEQSFGQFTGARTLLEPYKFVISNLISG